jgi:hypothetical protein
LIEGKTGWIVVDALTSRECCRGHGLRPPAVGRQARDGIGVHAQSH